MITTGGLVLLCVATAFSHKFRRFCSFSAHFFVFMAIFGHAEVVGGRLEGPHAVGHGETRGEPREWG